MKEKKGKIRLKTSNSEDFEFFDEAIFIPSSFELKNQFNSEFGEFGGISTLSPCEVQLKNNSSIKTNDQIIFDFSYEENNRFIKISVRGVVLSIKSDRYSIDPVFYSFHLDDDELIHVEREFYR